MKKKIALHIVIIILLSIPLFFMFKAWANLNQSSSPMYTYETVTATEPRVYVTNYGNHYHSPSCGSLWNSKIAMGKQEAISKGYTACSKCGGKPSGTIQTTYKKKVEKDVNSAGFIVGYIFLGLLVAAAIDGIAYGCIYAYRENHPKLTAVSTGNSPITNSIDSSNIFTKKLQPTPSTSPPKATVQVRVGSVVSHKSFGEGTITEFDGHYLTIEFPIGVKQFVYPTSFESFLSLVKY